MTTEGRRQQLRQQALTKATLTELVGAGAYPEPVAEPGGWSIELPQTEGKLLVVAASHPRRLIDARTWLRQHRAEAKWTGLVDRGWKLPDQVRRVAQLHMPFEEWAALYGELEFLKRDRRRLLET